MFSLYQNNTTLVSLVNKRKSQIKKTQKINMISKSHVSFKIYFNEVQYTWFVAVKSILKRCNLMPYTSVMLFWFELQVSIAVLISRGFFFFSKLLYLFLRSGHDGGEHGWPWHDWSVQGHQAVVEHLVLGDQFLGHVAAVKIRKRNVYHSLPQTSTKFLLTFEKLFFSS